MLASFLVVLSPQRTARVGRTVGRSLHALLLNLVDQVDPALAEHLHADAKVKSFTTSFLQGRFDYRQGRAHTVPDERYWVRYTLMENAVIAALSQALVGKQFYEDPVILEGSPYDIVDVITDPERSKGWARLTTYETLIETAGVDERIILEFSSPTTFRQGDVNLLFPLPVSVFASYLRRWQALAPTPIADEGLLDFVTERVVAERYDLRTKIVTYGDHQYNGCVGVCQYRVLSDDIGRVRLLNQLADYALFCGTGQKTTQGLGQTRRLPRWPQET